MVAGGATVVVGLVIAIPTALIPNALYQRMTAAPWWSYPVWVLTAALTGLLIASYLWPPARLPRSSPAPARAGVIGTVGSALAVGCPLCNKVVVAAVGFGGALGLWAPVQPVLAVLSLALLGWALWRRRGAWRGCPVAVGAQTDVVAGVSVPGSVG